MNNLEKNISDGKFVVIASLSNEEASYFQNKVYIKNILELGNEEVLYNFSKLFENTNNDDQDNKESENEYIKLFRYSVFEIEFKGKIIIFFCVGNEEFKEISILKILNSLKNTTGYGISFKERILWTDSIIHSIGNFIKKSINLEFVEIGSGYSLMDRHIKLLFSYLNNHEKITYLNVRSPNLTNNCIQDFIDIIKLTHIDSVHFINMPHLDVTPLFYPLLNNLIYNKNPKIIFRFKNLRDEHIIKLSDIIKEKCINYITNIDFFSNKITSIASSKLFQSLLDSKNENIVNINFGDNLLDDGCIEDLSRLIEENEKITSISLMENKITDKGMEILYSSIIGKTFIEKLDFSNNSGITDISSQYIKCIAEQSHVNKIILTKLNITDDNIKEIKRCLSIPIEEREIPLITIGNVKSASKRMKE